VRNQILDNPKKFDHLRLEFKSQFNDGMLIWKKFDLKQTKKKTFNFTFAFLDICSIGSHETSQTVNNNGI
jgi:hypothetical protein